MPASKAQRAATAERRAKAIALALAGTDWQTIADRLGYASRGAAYTDVDRAMKASLAEQDTNAEQRRHVESLRLDRLQAAVWPKAVKGDPRCAEVALKIIDRRIRLHGLDAPTRISVEAENLGREIGELLAALAAEQAAE